MNDVVLIIGGGIAGVSTALFLDSVGIKSRIFEAYGGLKNVGGGLQLYPNALNALEEIGLAEKVIVAGSVMSAIEYEKHNGKLITRSRLSTQDTFGQPSITIRRHSLHTILINRALKKGIPVEYGKVARKITQFADCIEVHFADGTTAEGSLLIGADGVNSTVRDYVEPKFRGPKPANLSIYFGFVSKSTVDQKCDPGSSMKITLGPRGFFGRVYADNTERTPEPEILWWSYVNPKRYFGNAQLGNLGNADIREMLLAEHRGWNEPIKSLLAEASDISGVRMSDVSGVEKWSRGRALVIGDAVHAMSPLVGQGAGTAIEDGVVLSKLFQIMGNQSTEVFKSFEKLRKNRVKKLVSKGRANNRNISVMMPTPLLPFRDSLIIILDKLWSLEKNRDLLGWKY